MELFLSSIFGLIVVCGLICYLFFYYIGRLYSQSLRTVTLRIFPYEAHGSFDEVKEIRASEELFARLTALCIPIVFELVVQGVGEGIACYLTVARTHEDLVKREVQALLFGARMVQEDEHQVWLHGITIGGRNAGLGDMHHGFFVRQTKEFSLPLRTIRDQTKSPFLAMLRVFSGLHILGEGGGIQVLIKPADFSYAKKIGNRIEYLTQGAYQGGTLLDKDFIITPESIRLLEQKVSRPLLSVVARVLVTGSSQRAKDISDQLAIILKTASHGANFNRLEEVVPRDSNIFIRGFLDRRFDPKQQMILSTEELASLIRFPSRQTPVPKLFA